MRTCLDVFSGHQSGYFLLDKKAKGYFLFIYTFIHLFETFSRPTFILLIQLSQIIYLFQSKYCYSFFVLRCIIWYCHICNNKLYHLAYPKMRQSLCHIREQARKSEIVLMKTVETSICQNNSGCRLQYPLERSRWALLNVVKS